MKTSIQKTLLAVAVSSAALHKPLTMQLYKVVSTMPTKVASTRVPGYLT